MTIEFHSTKSPMASWQVNHKFSIRWRFIILSIYLLLVSNSMQGQVSVRDSVFSFSIASITGGYSLPGGDLADRFGGNFSIGGNYFRKHRSNWLFGVQGDFLFGDRVKERDFLYSLSNSQGQIITQNGTYGNILLYERGWRVEARIGKILPVIGPNKNCGLVVMGGVGFLQHKIRIESQGDNIPSLEGNYVKGYDRLSNGLSISEFIGYFNFGNRRRINFFVGLEATQAFTKSRRDFDFDTRMRDDQERNDLLFGIRAGWIIPLYKKIPNAYYFD